jgi:hypothetical protein
MADLEGYTPSEDGPFQYTPTPEERDLAIRTLWGEGRGQPDEGLQGIAHVIRNRQQTEGFGDTVDDVIKQPIQFSMWNKGDPNGPKALALSQDDPEYQRMGKIVDGVWGGQIPDPTNGATHYYNPDTASPDWGDKLAAQNEVKLGAHRFVGSMDADGNVGPGTRALASTSQSDAVNDPSVTAAQGGSAPAQGALNPQSWGAGALQDPHRWSQGLTKLGAALMARDNPTGAQALLAANKPPDADGVTTSTKPTANGKALMITKVDKRGNVSTSYQPIPGQYQEKQDEDTREKPSGTLPIKEGQLRKDLDITGSLVDDINKMQDYVMKNNLQLSFDQKGIATVKNMTGNADQNSDAVKEAERLVERIRQRFLTQEAGPTTRAKLEQTMKIMFPNSATNDPATYLQSMEKAKHDLLTNYSNDYDTVSGLHKNFKFEKQVFKDGKKQDFDEYHQNKIKSWDAAQNDLTPKIEEFRRNHFNRTRQSTAPQRPSFSSWALGNPAPQSAVPQASPFINDGMPQP